MRRVAVTGMGVVSPLGNSAAEVFFHCRSGRSGVRVLDAPFAQRLGSPVAGVASFDGALHFDGPKLRMLDRVSQM
ncbi:MAG: beta-ketoacyl-[acyl-carrier-protein] synthase family protein, partial [Rhodoferax sp.]|nr:beta-ketoacyl-[acyl-carrier-protein] synthase family protein [Rhodoferax sp.]